MISTTRKTVSPAALCGIFQLREVKAIRPAVAVHRAATKRLDPPLTQPIGSAGARNGGLVCWGGSIAIAERRADPNETDKIDKIIHS